MGGGDKKGGGSDGYVSPHTGEYEGLLWQALQNRLGMNSNRGAGAYPSATTASNSSYGGTGWATRPMRNVSQPATPPASYYGVPGTVGSNAPFGSGISLRSSPAKLRPAFAPTLGNFGTGGGSSQAVASDRNVGQPLYGSRGVKEASSGYDFTPVEDAISGFRNPAKFTENYNSQYRPKAYNAFKYDFKDTPNEYYDQAFNMGAKKLREQNAGDLQEIQESMGVRRPGLLLKAAEGSKRNLESSLGDLGSNLGLERMRMGTDLAVKEQVEQAAENFRAAGFSDQQAMQMAQEQYRGYQSRADREKANADERFRNLNALAQTGGQQVTLKSGLVENERVYQDKAIQYLMQLFANAAGLQNQAAQISNSQSGSTMGSLGSLMSLGGLFGGGGATSLGALAAAAAV